MDDRDDPERRLDARLSDWDARLDRVEAQARPSHAIETPPERPTPGRHILLVPSPSGYELVEREGESPSTGELVELDGRACSYAVTRVVRSPLPDDRRRCAVLELTSIM
jgi:hypothetical protein